MREFDDGDRQSRPKQRGETGKGGTPLANVAGIAIDFGL